MADLETDSEVADLESVVAEVADWELEIEVILVFAVLCNH